MRSFFKQSLLTTILAGAGILSFVGIGVSHYDGNVSGLLHMDRPFGELHNVPEGLVLYTDAAYDGMLYYQVARDLPALLTSGKTSLDSPYRFQRILLPLLTYIVTVGNEKAFPAAMLIINILASLAALIVMLRMTKKVSVHALATIVNPAILVGILYMLTEPLSLLFVVLFLFFWEKNKRKMNATTVIMLILSLLARETTVFLIALLVLWYLLHRQWKQAVVSAIPFAVLFVWQTFLVNQLGSVAFQANSNIVSFPFGGPAQLILWLIDGITAYRLSGLGLLLFVLALFGILMREWIRKKLRVGAYCFLVSGLCATMLIMDSHMWGAITSIGRVVTPIYPVYALYAAKRDTWVERTVSSILIVVSLVAALGIALVGHPYVIS